MANYTSDERLFVKDLIRENKKITDGQIFSRVSSLRKELLDNAPEQGPTTPTPEQQEEFRVTEEGQPEGNIRKVVKAPGRAWEAFQETREAGLSKIDKINELGTEQNVGSRAWQGFGAAEEAFIEAPVVGLRELTSPILDIIMDAIPDGIKEFAGDTAKQVASDLSAVGDIVGGVVKVSKEKFDKLSPEAQRNIIATREAFSLPIELGEAFGVGTTIGTPSGVITSGKKKFKKVVEGIEFGDIGESFKKKSKEKVEKKVGEVVQGKIKDQPAAVSALGELDTSKVKTYKHLEETIDKRVSKHSTELDKLLDTKPFPRALDSLVVTEKVGDTKVSQNFVKRALTQLEEVYTKGQDAGNVARIINIKKKAIKDGLTLKEINNIAKEYGSEFKNKAFSKVSKEPLTSVSADAFENTRQGLKKTFRDLLDDPRAIELDLKQSNLLHTKDLVSKMSENVNKLEQKLRKIGVVEKISAMTGKAINTLSFNTLKGLASSLLSKKLADTTLDALQLEKLLKKNLKDLDKLVALDDPNKIAAMFVDLFMASPSIQEEIKDNQQKKEKE